jgi:hypothetical protein
MKVFISSTQKDLDLARDLAQRLHEIGFQVFTAEDTRKARNERALPIDRHLRRVRLSDEVILLFTENAIRNEKILFEIGAAFSLHKKITPIIVGVGVDELPPMIRHLPLVRYAEITNYLAKLKKRVRTSSKAHRQPLHAN